MHRLQMMQMPVLPVPVAWAWAVVQVWAPDVAWVWGEVTVWAWDTAWGLVWADGPMLPPCQVNVPTPMPGPRGSAKMPVVLPKSSSPDLAVPVAIPVSQAGPVKASQGQLAPKAVAHVEQPVVEVARLVSRAVSARASPVQVVLKDATAAVKVVAVLVAVWVPVKALHVIGSPLWVAPTGAVVAAKGVVVVAGVCVLVKAGPARASQPCVAHRDAAVADRVVVVLAGV